VSNFARRSPPRFILEIDIGDLLPIGVAHDKASGLLVDRARRREAAGGQPARFVM